MSHKSVLICFSVSCLAIIEFPSFSTTLWGHTPAKSNFRICIQAIGQRVYLIPRITFCPTVARNLLTIFMTKYRSSNREIREIA